MDSLRREGVEWVRGLRVLGRLPGWYVAVGVVAAVVGLAVLPSVTSADPTCTVTWTGDAGDGLWQTAENWSTDSVPGSSDVACIGSGATVHVTGGSNQVGTVLDEGTLDISGGSLELTGSELSTAVTVALSSGSLTGAGELDVSGSILVDWWVDDGFG